MKKLFLLLTAVLLSAGMVVQAQLLDAVNDSPERGYVFDDNGQVSGRNNAPQANYTQHYSWTTDLAVNGIVMNSGSSLGNSNYIVWQCQLVPNYLNTNSITYPAVSFSFGINYYSSGYATYDSGQEGPLPGTYTYSNTTTWGQIPGKLVCNQSLNKSFFINSSGTKLYFTGGSVVVQQGRHGRPYMYTSSLKNSSNNFDITIGDPYSITTTYTSVTVAKADENNKVVLYANDGNGNNLNLIFNVGSIDTNIGVPAGTYTIGTNAWGSLHDDDGYTDWSLTSGSITISKNGSALSMSTSSLKGKVDDTNYNLNLTISNRTPTMKTITNIPVASASVNKYSGYFNVIGSSSPYDVRLESASVDYRTGYFAHNELEQTNEYTYLKQNNSNIALDYNKQQALITAVGSNIFTEAFVCSTSGTVYRIAAFNGAAYTITYKDQGDAAFTGTHSSGYPTTHLYGTNTPLGTATKSNHTFDGWFDNSSCTGTPLTSIEATAKTSNFTLYAKWTNNTPVGTTYTLTLNAGAHGTVTVYNNTKNYNVTFTNNEAEIAEDDEIVITYSPAAGYHVGTHTDSEEGTFNSGDGIFMDGDHTITVTFEPDVYNITYKDKGNVAFTGTHGSGYPTTHTYGTATALVNPTKANATFGGWYTNSACTGEAVTTLGANTYLDHITLYAKWANNGKLTITSNYGAVSGTGYVADPDHIYTGGTEVQLGVTANPGYAFVQWSDGNTDNPRTVYIDGDAEYTAQFVVETAGYASFSFDNPNDDIQIGKITQPSSMCQTEFYPYGISLVEIIAKNTTRTTKNYLQMYIKTNNFRTYNPVSGGSYYGPAYGTYSVSVPSEYGPVIGNCDNSIYESNYYFVYTGDATDVVIGYKVETASHGGTCHFQGYEGTLSQRLCVYSSYGADYSNETRSNFATFNNGTITVAEGAGGNPYITVRINGVLALTVGAPALPYTLAWDANGGELSGTYTAAGSVNEGTTITAPTATRTGYTFTGWSPAFTGFMPAANTTYVAQWTPQTYNITYNDNGDESYSGSNLASLPATHTYNTITNLVNGVKTGYTFGGWYENPACTGAAVTNIGATAKTADFTLYAQWTANTHNVSWVTDGNALTGTYTNGTTAFGTAIVAPETPTKNATAQYTYTFNGWTPAVDATMPDNDVTYTATWTQAKVQYTLTWDVNGGNELTGTYTSGTIDWGTDIVKPADPTKAGYTFNGWDANNDGTADNVAATMPTDNVTYKALWILSSMDALTLLDKESATYYDNFQDYDGVDVETVTYTRNFTAGNWSTLCLPFDVTEGNLILNGLSGQVFAFQHATGNANVGSQVLLYFNQVSSLEAGVPYLVRTRSNKSNFTFESVTINTEADTEADITDLGKTHMTEGTIALVGTLRKGTLPKGDKHYMGLIGNKIYYPGENTTVPAYRAYFYDSNPSGVQQRVRIVVDGEDMGELLIDNGELLDAGGDDRAPRKYIRHGNLYIEREGVTYDAQGKRM